MTLTRNIIQEVVKQEIKSELVPVIARLDEIVDILKNLTTEMKTVKVTVIDFAGDVKKFDEEQTVMFDRQSKHSDNLEKLNLKVFGKMSFA